MCIPVGLYYCCLFKCGILQEEEEESDADSELAVKGTGMKVV